MKLLSSEDTTTGAVVDQLTRQSPNGIRHHRGSDGKSASVGAGYTMACLSGMAQLVLLEAYAGTGVNSHLIPLNNHVDRFQEVQPAVTDVPMKLPAGTMRCWS